MNPKIKNTIMFAIIVVILILVYIFFIKKAPEEESLVSSSEDTTSVDADTLDENSLIAKNFLSVLLNVNNIKLNDVIFSDGAFVNLHDSSILLTSPEEKGRLNPFAPIGYDTPKTPVAPTIIESPQSATEPASSLTPSANLQQTNLESSETH